MFSKLFVISLLDLNIIKISFELKKKWAPKPHPGRLVALLVGLIAVA